MGWRLFSAPILSTGAMRLGNRRALKEHPRIALRMGIHSGPVNEVVDVNQRQNIAGAGINMAQRVMDCGDAGHILVSKHVAEDLEQHDRWRPLLHDLGSCEVKHGVRLDISNLYSNEVGNSQLPKKLQAVKNHRAHVRWAAVAIGLLLVAALAALVLSFFAQGPARSLATAVEKSIAVLPFDNLSGAADNNDFSDGITEEILNALSQISDLKVAARTSAFQFKGRNVDLRQVGETLGVAHVLEGSVQRAGDDVRITAQLIDARTGYHKWSQKYDRKLTSIFAIEDEISKAIATQMQVALGNDREQPLVKPGTCRSASARILSQRFGANHRARSGAERGSQVFQRSDRD